MSQLFPLFEEESSNDDYVSGLFSHLNISSQFFERELAEELNEINNKIISQPDKERATHFAKGKIFRIIKSNLEKLMEFNYMN